MDLESARKLLTEAYAGDDPVILPGNLLSDLTASDIPEGVSIEIGWNKDGVINLDWGGKLFSSGGRVCAEADYTFSRKYWYEPIGLEHYYDLMRRGIEARAKINGDVSLVEYDDDGAYVSLLFEITTDHSNLGKGYDRIRKVCSELEEPALQIAQDVGQRISNLADRISGWGSEPFDSLLSGVEQGKSAAEKGRKLEELVSRLFATVPKFTVTGHILTKTEEIDVSVINDSEEARLKREGALILIECKNWSTKCGKDEFVLFHEKVKNRIHRCSLGFLISWNGFAKTVTKEMMRGSRESAVIVPMTGEDIRTAVRTGDFQTVLLRCWDKAVSL